ncbi:hypothetical protein J2T55_001585 [Methylohalomonas lacus]|uniref:Uncharacterized protein n=1 Tax=Methylohalomonas lacus TaxID=398773 RepID=A0AAE3HJK4_9GAMM|nr:hypothetical protein [Methylohalomonas lacus]
MLSMTYYGSLFSLNDTIATTPRQRENSILYTPGSCAPADLPNSLLNSTPILGKIVFVNVKNSQVISIH